MLKNGRARALRFTTLDSICRELDCQLEVVVAEPASGARRRARPTERSVAADIGDPAELLVVLVDERARMAGVVAPDRQTGPPIEIGQTRVGVGILDSRSDQPGTIG